MNLTVLDFEAEARWAREKGELERAEIFTRIARRKKTKAKKIAVEIKVDDRASDACAAIAEAWRRAFLSSAP